MHKLLQQARRFIVEEKLFVVILLFLFSLPFYAGQIISTAPAQIFTHYINYLHIRISLHLILSLVLCFFSLRDVSFKKFAIKIFYFFLLASVVSLLPMHTVSVQYQLPFWLLIGTSVFHLAEFLLKATAFLFVIEYLLKITDTWRKDLVVWCILLGSLIQSMFVLGQRIIGGPILPTWLSWAGQPPEFTSKAIIGIFEYSRAYGTTPHPNILAAVAVFYLLTLLCLGVRKKIVLGISVLLLGIVLASFSKIGLLAFVTIGVIYQLRTSLANLKVRASTILMLLSLANIAIIIMTQIIYHYHIPVPYLESRAVIQQLYLELIGLHPLQLLTGTGFVMAIPNLLANTASLGTSLFWYSRILAEPPHNAFLLLIIEFGLPITGLFLWMIWGQVKSWAVSLLPWQILSILLLITAFGGLDHFLVY